MAYMFYKSVFSGDISNWDTRNVNNMRHMFDKRSRAICPWYEIEESYKNMDKRALYESIMMNVAKHVKKALNEEFSDNDKKLLKHGKLNKKLIGDEASSDVRINKKHKSQL